MKNKDIIKILESNAKEGWSGDATAVGYFDFEEVSKQLIKLYNKNKKKVLKTAELLLRSIISADPTNEEVVVKDLRKICEKLIKQLK